MPYLGVCLPEAWLEKSIEDAGELPGVPAMVALENDRSAEMILEIDSRNREFCLELTGSSMLSRLSMTSVRSRNLDDRSLCRRSISPFTVRRSFKPF
jgi:hypothetical protein